MSETAVVCDHAPAADRPTSQKPAPQTKTASPNFGSFQSYTSSLHAAAARNASRAELSSDRDACLGQGKIGKVDVIVTLDKLTRWGHKPCVRAQSKPTACGLLVLRISFDEDHNYHLQSASGSLDFPAGSHLDHLCPLGLQGRRQEKRVGKEKQFMPEFEGGGMVSAGGMGVRKTAEMSEYENWVFIADRKPIETDFRRLWWRLEDQETSRSGVFNRPVHLLASVLFDNQDQLQPFDIKLHVDGRLRSRHHRLRRKMFRLGSASNATTTRIAPLFQDPRILLEPFHVHLNELEAHVRERNRTLPEVIEDTSTPIVLGSSTTSP
ncbi:hypothetical protein BDZ85DRAFT_18360 [Elsinoe ampelina]|uniref:Uncharacterized protein n=1 Tax=Elsinoe ampelina TaxID=302913 RepID=A0A6A6G782_9PEZI|nr:hypothetical protein BDZ85DRAFT_18360 [Elsinoe ampelina]